MLNILVKYLNGFLGATRLVSMSIYNGEFPNLLRVFSNGWAWMPLVSGMTKDILADRN